MSFCVLVADWNVQEERFSLATQILHPSDHRSSWSDPLSALAEALRRRAKDKAVIIRPSFNEIDEHGSFFREWRSFNGESFCEIRWYMRDLTGVYLKHEPPVRTVLADRDIVLPNLPPVPTCACEEEITDFEIIEERSTSDDA